MNRIRTALLAAATTSIALLAATPALAHIDPDPEEAPAGSVQSVGFTVEHGCDGSATIQLDMRLPAGIMDATTEPPAGWTGAVAGDVVTFTGGPLPDDVEGTFRVRMTLPSTPGATIYFPFVQRCEAGEIRWIDVPDDGSSGEEPAPALLLLDPLPTTTSAATSTTTTPPTTTTTTPSTTAPLSTTTTAATTTAPTTTAAPTTTTTPATSTNAPPDDDGGNGALPIAIAGLAAGGVVLGGLATWLIRRRA